MADVSDCEIALRDAVSVAVYPNGTGQASAIGAPVRVYRGWPNAEALDRDLRNHVCNISVFPEAGGRNTTRYGTEWQGLTIAPVTLTATVSGATVTMGGTATIGQIVGIRTLAGAWAYATQAGD